MARKSLETRFWLKVDKKPGFGPHGNCWLWTACRALNGYGQMNLGSGRKAMAHRLAWAFRHHEEIPPKMYICHTCDNPPCVNPDHLFLGTPSMNMIDCKDKGRHRFGTVSGSKSRFAKLTEEQVIRVRQLVKGGMRQIDVARQFGMSRSGINHITSRRKWKHLG